MGFFLVLALRLSARFSGIAQRYSEQRIDSSTEISRFVLHLNTVKRLGITGFFLGQYRRALDANWDRLEEYKNFHARRWLIQLNLFNLLYVLTLFYGIYQVKIGVLGLGFLVLIKYSFDQLWGILVYLIEYYVTLLQQREDTRIIRRELEQALSEEDRKPREVVPLDGWKELKLIDASTEFEGKGPGHPPIRVSIPEFVIRRGEKVAVIGPSGTGKTSLLNMLLTLIPFRGGYFLDGRDIADKSVAPQGISFINSVDPLFVLTLRANILLGRTVDEDRLRQVLAGVRADFIGNLDLKVGAASFNLSAGQEQRIRLARGLLGDAELYLLDEPFSGIDTENKRQVMTFLRAYLIDAAIVLVTHNPEELALADRVYELRDGVLRESTAARA
jgi:ABC-type bacteriocin/lantibiotic exporter with double-glycine peptidase domain